MTIPALVPTNIRDEAFEGGKYHLQGELVPALICELTTGSIYFEHHVLLWKSPRLTIGIKKIAGAFKRMMAGLPIFITGTDGQGQIALSRDGAGQICPIHLKAGEAIEVREHQFLAASGNMAYTFSLIKGISNMFFGGTGFFVDRFTCQNGNGVVWVHGYGNVFEITLTKDQQIDVEPSAWVYKDPSVHMETKLQRLTAGLLGAQGQLVINRFSGPGRVGIQTMSLYFPETK